MHLFDVDLNSDRNRAILRFLFGKAGSAIARVFPTRAAACYSGLVTGLALAFVPIAKAAPVKVTLMMTIAGAGLVAVSAHELDELQDDIDEQRTQKERDRQLRLFADTEAKNKVAETNLLRHGYELDKSLPPELQQAISPASSETETVSPSDRAAFDAAISAAQTSQRQTQSNHSAATTKRRSHSRRNDSRRPTARLCSPLYPLHYNNGADCPALGEHDRRGRSRRRQRHVCL